MKRLKEQLKKEWKEKGWKHKFLAVLAGVEVTFSIFLPIIIGTLWISVVGVKVSSYFIYGLGLLATLFRAIKMGMIK